MNLEMPEKEKLSKKRIAIYVSAIAVCIFAIIIVVGVQVLGDDIINNAFGLNKIVKRTEQEETELKSNFENIFDNNLKNLDNYVVQKKDENLEIVYTNYTKEEKTSEYELNVNIPFININNKHIETFNQEMKDTFEQKAEQILESESSNAIYTVKYKANIESNILSLVMYCDLKQGTSAQRVIVQTFNYDLENNKKLSFQETIEKYGLSENDVQNKIDKNIISEQEKAEQLKELGYNVFSRDAKSEIYKLENVKEFFIYDSNIYIIFAYGNENMTSEMDLVII